MGQKVHPTGFRLGIVKDHTSIWYADGPAYADKLHIDMKVRAYLLKRLAQASVSQSRFAARHKLPVLRFTRLALVS